MFGRRVRFSEDVSRIFGSLDVVDLDVSFLFLIVYEMTMGVDVFGLLVCYWTMHECLS